jgi:hypothetical protein
MKKREKAIRKCKVEEWYMGARAVRGKKKAMLRRRNMMNQKDI